jgi:GNAT superfamily N-acetyltransferase
MWRLYFQLSPEGRKRYYDEMMPLLHHTKAEVLGDRDDDSYYLVYLGTKPSGRGRGYARKLLENMIARVGSTLSYSPIPPPSSPCRERVESLSYTLTKWGVCRKRNAM